MRDVKYWFMCRLRDREGATAGSSTDPPAEYNEIAATAGLQEGQVSLLQGPNQYLCSLFFSPFFMSQVPHPLPI